MGNEQPIPYWDGRDSKLPGAAERQGGFGVVSVWCFVVFAACAPASIAFAVYGSDLYARWGWHGAIVGWVLAGLVLVPLGIFCGLIGLTYPPARRVAAIAGLLLNGAAVVAFVALRWR